uniref:Uncharacterized protein n=1 Tax=Bactrocera latifrons TaxID=174628 RepID=A0A0K8U4Z2_BACLA
MLSSKSSVCLFLLLSIATLLPTTTTTTPATTMKTTTKKSLQSNPTNPQNIEDYGKSVKIIFPNNNDSEDNSKFDVYGLKTTPPPPNQEEVKIEDKIATTEATINTTMKSTTGDSDSVSNSTVKSFDNRIGVLNLAPHCPEGTVIVNQRCHKSA